MSLIIKNDKQNNEEESVANHFYKLSKYRSLERLRFDKTKVGLSPI